MTGATTDVVREATFVIEQVTENPRALELSRT